MIYRMSEGKEVHEPEEERNWTEIETVSLSRACKIGERRNLIEGCRIPLERSIHGWVLEDLFSCSSQS